MRAIPASARQQRSNCGRPEARAPKAEDSPDFHQWHLSLERKFGRDGGRGKRNRGVR
jgi:hypothetical protein